MSETKGDFSIPMPETASGVVESVGSAVPNAIDSLVNKPSSKELMIGGGVLLILAVLFLVIRSNFVQSRIKNHVSPNQANTCGWFLFLTLLFWSAIPILFFMHKSLFSAIYIAPLGGLGLLCLVLVMVNFSPKK